MKHINFVDQIFSLTAIWTGFPFWCPQAAPASVNQMRHKAQCRGRISVCVCFVLRLKACFRDFRLGTVFASLFRIQRVFRSPSLGLTGWKDSQLKMRRHQLF